jgi:prepilin-type processing-associated H-X9-DG protein
MQILLHHPARDKKPEAAFGRVDFVAMTAIIVLLAVMFSPAWARTRIIDQSISCRNNFRQLMGAMLMYTHDYNDFLPPNPDDGNTAPFFNWCAGNVAIGGPDEFNSDLLKDRTHSQLVPYIATNVTLFRCPADHRTGKSTASSTWGQIVPQARDCSMNQAVGTDPYAGGKLPVNGPWLDGAHNNTRNGAWLTYGKTTSILRPSPAMLLVLLDEAANSINDAAFAMSMVGIGTFIDCPGIYHNLGCTIAFADGHTELKNWTDQRINVWPAGMPYSPPNPDVIWVQARTSAHR